MVPIWRREFSNCQTCPVAKGGKEVRLFCLRVFKVTSYSTITVVRHHRFEKNAETY